MEYYWKFIRFKLLMNKRLPFYVLSFFFICLCAFFGTIKHGYPQGPILNVSFFLSKSTYPLTGQVYFRFQRNELKIYNRGTSRLAGSTRKLLGGPGSSPPRCISKCGRCRPCQPVHVSVLPGRPVTAEYYPEAWGCKCGNKLYMP